MKLSILVPFRDADGTRTRGKEWIQRRWAHFWPEAEIIEASDDGLEPFNKCLAVNNAAAKATGDVYMILDADSWIDTRFTRPAMERIERGHASWVVPAGRSYRLTREASERYLACDPTGQIPRVESHMAEQRGTVIGFCWMVPAELWWKAAWYKDGQPRGMDERIRGWGGEDWLWSWVLDRVAGEPHYRGSALVMSLWHERPRQARLGRVWLGQDRTSQAEQAKQAILSEYKSGDLMSVLRP